MTVAAAGKHEGLLREVVREERLATDEPLIEFAERRGPINADLTIGTDITRASSLVANDGLCSPGVKLHGNGFIVTREDAMRLGLESRPGLNQHIRKYLNGRDLTARSRDVMVIDLFGRSAEDVRRCFPEIYQYLVETVKPERDRNNRSSYRESWWIFGEPRRELRPALGDLERYVATVETMKHRIFVFLKKEILPDNRLIVMASEDAFVLGVLSSRIHAIWSLASGGTLEDRPHIYEELDALTIFPFPDTTATLKAEIRALAEELDNVRKLVLEEYRDLTLTSLYNVLDKLNRNVALDKKDQYIKSRGRVLILKELHNKIDVAVTLAYRWPSDISDDEILKRLVALNLERAADERRGFIRWLRPDYQTERLGPLAHRADRIQSIDIMGVPKTKNGFPIERRDQAGQILNMLNRSNSPLTVDQISSQFKDGRHVKSNVIDVLKSLNRLGEIETHDEGVTYFRYY